MDKTMWCVKHCGPDEWLGCEPGWYWGEVADADGGDVTLGDSVGPFPSMPDALLDMTRSVVERSLQRGVPN